MSQKILIPHEGEYFQSYNECRCQADYLAKYVRLADEAIRLNGRKNFAGRDMDRTAKFHMRYIRELYALNQWDLTELDRIDTEVHSQQRDGAESNAH